MNPKLNVFLSKSKYLHGLQCPKLLWYEYNRKADIPPPDAVVQLAFDEGKRVGELAHKLYPGGILLKREWDPEKHHERSMQALKQRKPLFEAGFIHNRAYALADILVPVEKDGWDLIEVKSSTSVKEGYYDDAAFQRYTYEGAGVNIRRCYVMYINNEYVRRGEIEPEKLFLKEEITKQSGILMHKIASEKDAMLKIITNKDVPDVAIGQYCKSPHGCPLQGLCWSFLPDKGSIFILYSGGKRSFELLEQGIAELKNIPDDYKLNYKQVIQVEAHRSGKPYIDKEAIQEFLKKIEYPLYFLDFETIRPAIPIYDLTRPHESIPFQYSLNIIEKEGAKPLHHFYLAPGAGDPRSEILKQLKKFIEEKGSILAYNASFEKGCLKKASETYPEYGEWVESLMSRFVDLLEPFQKFNYYHPDQAGRASLKNVLPAVAGVGYQGMEIADGAVASAEYYRVTFGKDIDAEDRKRVRHALEKYCRLDTMGMIKILEVLKEISRQT